MKCITIINILILSVSILPNLCFAKNLKITKEEAQNNNLTLTIVHFNDFHARFDEQSPSSGVCKPGDLCHGGFARLYQSIMDLMDTATNPILLNAGDNFQGTLWYTLFRWQVTEIFMNLLPIKAYTLGNHEFDDNIEGLVPFMKAMKSPAVVCNLNDSLVPEIQNLYKKSITFEIEGKKIAIVGAALSTTNEISNTGDLEFLDESESINAEVERLVQEENIFSAIILSHAGYDRDLEIARKATKKISLIVGGHSHTFLNDGPGEDGSIPEGPYPTIIQRDLDNQPVPIVQAAAYTKYLGNLQITLGANGEALSWSGKPIYLAPYLPKNKEVEQILQPFKDIVTSKGEEVYGETAVVLDQSNCRHLECNLGNLITDAMVFAYKDKTKGDNWTNVSLAIMNSGGIRATIPIGNITYNDLITTQPFANTFDVGLLQGKYIKEFLEFCAIPMSFRDGDSNVNLLQLSGFRVVYDLSKPVYERVIEVKVLCSDCSKPIYEDLNLHKDYKLIVPSFIGGGGDAFTMISDNLKDYQVGEEDMAVFKKYLPLVSPIDIGIEGRITFIGRKHSHIVKRGIDDSWKLL